MPFATSYNRTEADTISGAAETITGALEIKQACSAFSNALLRPPCLLRKGAAAAKAAAGIHGRERPETSSRGKHLPGFPFPCGVVPYKLRVPRTNQLDPIVRARANTSIHARRPHPGASGVCTETTVIDQCARTISSEPLLCSATRTLLHACDGELILAKGIQGMQEELGMSRRRDQDVLRSTRI